MAGNGPGSCNKDALPLPGVYTEEMSHAVVGCGVKGKVTSRASDAEHIGTNHKAGYDSHKSAKSSFPGKAGTET